MTGRGEQHQATLPHKMDCSSCGGQRRRCWSSFCPGFWLPSAQTLLMARSHDVCSSAVKWRSTSPDNQSCLQLSNRD